MDSDVKIWWMDGDEIPTNVKDAVGERWDIAPLHDNETPACGSVGVGFGTPTEGVDGDFFSLRVLPDTNRDVLTAKLETAAAAAGSILELQRDISRIQAIADQAAMTAEELDEEIRLAARLQQDFLPRRLPKIGTSRFSVYYQPAGFVSGDIYDVARLDETRIGFYVADAVGHGLPAALLTMFIKEALQTKRITGNSYEIVPPHEVLEQLNAHLCRQHLQMCEFCTAVYAIVDTQTLTVTMSRAGHPAPIIINPDGAPREVDLPGPLLGIMDDAVFESREIQLEPNDRLLLYSDGVEDSICGTGKEKIMSFVDFIAPFSSIPREDFLQHISGRLDNQDAYDDITVLMLEV
ncbi:MAG: serine/threonine-protein phosphatase [Phycisphaerae bacterium]|nr:serine/threonine-protein phosphatase [Phycisphaerae bacterium]